MPHTRIKICGITRPEDAALAAELGVDFIGLNFVGGPRRLTEIQATQIYWSMRDDDVKLPRVDFVILADIDAESPHQPWNGSVSDFHYPTDILQVYSRNYDRHATDWALTSKKWWMVVPIQNRDSIVDFHVSLALGSLTPTGVVFDTASKTALGGTGQTFNWNWIAEARAAGELAGLPPIILAGGLNPDNVTEAIRIAQPYAVDVSSGVEVAGKPGVKDPIKMRDFIQAVRGA